MFLLSRQVGILLSVLALAGTLYFWNVTSTQEPWKASPSSAEAPMPLSQKSVPSPQVPLDPSQLANHPPALYDVLLFFPQKYPEGNWQPDSLKYEDVWFHASDGTKLHGWYCPCEGAKATILRLHGNGGNIAYGTDWATYLQRRFQVSVFHLDYRGYGRSEGIPTVEGALQDSRAARAKLAELAAIPESEIILMGESLGGAMAAQLAADIPPRALILQSTFPSLREIAGVHFPQLAWAVPADKLNSCEKLGTYEGPLFLSHGTADEVIPYALGEKLFEAAGGSKRWLSLPGVNHNDWLVHSYIKELESFLSDLPSP